MKLNIFSKSSTTSTAPINPLPSTVNLNSLQGLEGGDFVYHHTISTTASTSIPVYGSMYYTPENIREQRKQQLKSELKNDPELLNEILVDLRKDKIEKIKNKHAV